MVKTASKDGKLTVFIASASGLTKAEVEAEAAVAPPRTFGLLRGFCSNGKREVKASRQPGTSGLLARSCDLLVVCEVKGKPGLRFETPVVHDTLEPVWNVEYTFSDVSPGDSLAFTVLDKEVEQENGHLGQATLGPELLKDGFDDVVSLRGHKEGTPAMLRVRISPLELPEPSRLAGKTKSTSHSHFHMTNWLHMSDNHAASASNGKAFQAQDLKVKIISASGLRGADWMPGEGCNAGLSDPYCTVEIAGKPETRQRTVTIQESHSPKWDFEGHFNDYVSGDSLIFTVWDEDWGKADDLLGCSELHSMHFDPVAFEGDIRLSNVGEGYKSVVRVRVELADFEQTLGVTSNTGLGIRRKLWGTWARVAHVPVTQNLDSTATMSGLHLRQHLRRTPGTVAAALAKKKRAAKLVLMDMVLSRRQMALTAVRDSIKEACTADPDMCMGLRLWFMNLVDALWNDVMMEVEIMVESTRLGVAGHSLHDVQSLAEIGWQSPNIFHPLSIRGFLLYHYQPFDRSFFGQLKDPLYWVLLAISFVPVLRCFFFLAVLLLEVTPGPPDEYQLVQFILSFKATQFLSSGVALAIIGTWKYYWCVGRDGYHTCETGGPGESKSFFGRDTYGVLGVIDIVGSCGLVWTAFLILPHSVQNAGLRRQTETEEAEVTEEEHNVCLSCGQQWHHFQYEGRGGRLGGLLRYDLRCFLFSVLFLVVLEMWRFKEDPKGLLLDRGEAGGWMHTWKFRETLFVIRVMYGFSSFPFAVFNLPILSQILTHTVPTGYNRRGSAVAYLLPPVEPLKSQETPRSSGRCEEEEEHHLMP